jgi:hypothetical protein
VHPGFTAQRERHRRNRPVGTLAQPPSRAYAPSRRALAPAGTLLLVEMVIPPDNQPSPAHAMDLNMMVVLGGRERTEAEYQRLFQGAGFRLERVIPTHSPFSVIEARRI